MASKALIWAFLGVLALNLADAACPNLCRGNGLCNNPESVCNCFPTYFGADCSRRECATGPAWSARLSGTDSADRPDFECSGRGLCSYSTGTCNCFPGFEGEACERTTCPNGCSNRGVCLTMANLNDLYGIDAEPGETGDGIVPAYLNYEADNLQTCFCDWGFAGPDCSQRLCPSGDNPRTKYQQVRRGRGERMD